MLLPPIRARLASVLAVAAIGLTACGEGEEQTIATPPPRELSPRAERPIEVGGTPVAIAADDAGVWVVDNSGEQLLRLDPESPESRPERIPIPGGPSSVAIGEGAVWVAGGDGSITRVDPATGEASRLKPHVTQPGGIAAGDGSVWVTSSAANAVVRIDPVSGETVGDPIDVGQLPTDIAVGDGAVWVANTNDGSVTRIDASSGAARPPIEVADGLALALALGEEGVWIAKSDDEFGDEIEVVQIDPESSEIVGDPASVVAGIPVRVAAGEGGVWTTLVGGGQAVSGRGRSGVTLVDPVTGAASPEPLAVGERPGGIATGAGAVWVAGAGDGTVTRIDPQP